MRRSVWCSKSRRPISHDPLRLPKIKLYERRVPNISQQHEIATTHKEVREPKGGDTSDPRNHRASDDSKPLHSIGFLPLRAPRARQCYLKTNSVLQRTKRPRPEAGASFFVAQSQLSLTFDVVQASTHPKYIEISVSTRNGSVP
jgi:hypothetical protein